MDNNQNQQQNNGVPAPNVDINNEGDLNNQNGQPAPDQIIQPIIDSINQLVAQLGEQTLKMKSNNVVYKPSNAYQPINERRTNEEWINYIVSNPNRFSAEEVRIQRKNMGNPMQFALELQSSYPNMY